MSLEDTLPALLRTISPKVHADFAPAGVTRPYLVWQYIGGNALRYLDNTAADKRNTVVQIAAWCDGRLEALALIRAIEDALCASVTLTAVPLGEPDTDAEPETKAYGAIQRFSIYAAR